MPGSIDTTLAELIPLLPAEVRALAPSLPYHLGLCRDPHGRWDDFVTLPPNRDLPSFAAEWPAEPSLGPREVARFSRAHHLAAVWGLVADRLIDRQVLRTEALTLTRRLLLSAWVDALSDATGSRRYARGLIGVSVRRWRSGARLEQRASLARAQSLEGYLTSVHLKLHWIGTSAAAMFSESAERSLALRSAVDLFLLSCQLRDDALDDEEDRAQQGLSVAAVLGVHPGVLFRAAPRVVRAAQAEAVRGGFHRLARWLRSHAEQVDQRFMERDPTHDEAAAARLANLLLIQHLSRAL